MAQNQVRQNYHDESEAGVNRQINLELYAFYTYTSMVRNCAGSCRDFLSYSFFFSPYSPSTSSETMWPSPVSPSTSAKPQERNWNTPRYS